MPRPEESRIVESIARCVGETFRKHLGLHWTIELQDSKKSLLGRTNLLDGLRDRRGSTVAGYFVGPPESGQNLRRVVENT
jgi:hypothetical protein